LLPTKYHSDDKVKKIEMDRTCSTYGDRKRAYRVLVGKPEGRRPLGRPRRNGRIILKWVFERLDGGIAWIELAQDKEQVNTVTNFRVP
jgi:hypothetical protein